MFYSRELPVSGGYDVVVCGAGVAGFTAAVQAARLGAKTALVEKYGMPGGVMTVGGNNEIGLFYRGSRQIISGIGWKLVTRLAEKGWAKIPEFDEKYDHSQQNVIVNAPMAAAEMDEMCLEAGVELLYHHTLCDVMTENGRITAAVTAAKEGMKAITGRYFIDATGDADLTFFAGFGTMLGDDGGKTLQPGTLRFYWSGCDMGKISREQVEKSFAKGLESGEIVRSDYWSLGGSPYTVFAANGNNINHLDINGADSVSRSGAETEGRRSVARLAQWARKRVIGAENASPEICAPEVAVRESRRAVGEHIITAEEYVSGKEYDDGLCFSYYPVDLHTSGDSTLYNIAVKKDTVPQIPYSALIVKDAENLLAVGKCASGDRLAHSAFRVKASCMAMGQAAGCAAALASLKNTGLRGISADSIRSELKNQGAIVP